MSATLHFICEMIENDRWKNHIQNWKKNMENEENEKLEKLEEKLKTYSELCDYFYVDKDNYGPTYELIMHDDAWNHIYNLMPVDDVDGIMDKIKSNEFKKSMRENKDLFFGLVLYNPQTYQNKIIHIFQKGSDPEYLEWNLKVGEYL